MAAIILLFTLLVVLVLIPLPAIQGWGWDFFVYRAASRAMLSGEDPYLVENIRTFADGPGLATIPYFVYAPYFALLILPFSLFGAEASFRLWFLLNLVLLVASAALILHVLDIRPSARSVVVGGVALAFYSPVRTLLAIGQTAGLLLFALSLCLWLLKHSRPYLAGISLGVGLFKPHLLVVLPLLALRRQWATLAAAALAALVLSLPFIGLIGEWWQAMVATRAINLSYECLPFASLPGLLECVFAPGSLAAVEGVITVGLIALGVVLVLPEAAPSSLRFVLQFGFTLVLGLLLVDNVRVADLTLEIFPFLLCLVVVPKISRVNLRRAAIFFLLMAYVFPLASDVASTWSQMWSMPVWYTFSSIALSTAMALVLIAERTGSIRVA